jgi:hypothetical protein
MLITTMRIRQLQQENQTREDVNDGLIATLAWIGFVKFVCLASPLSRQ